MVKINIALAPFYAGHHVTESIKESSPVCNTVYSNGHGYLPLELKMEFTKVKWINIIGAKPVFIQMDGIV